MPCEAAAATGLPIGIRLIGPYRADDAVLDAAEWLERATDPKDCWPMR